MVKPDIDERLSQIERNEPPDLWEEIQGRQVSEPVHPERLRRFATAVAALGMAAAALVLVLWVFRSSPHRQTLGGTNVTRIGLGINWTASDVVAGEGALWTIATTKDYRYELARIDPQTLQVEQFPLGVSDADADIGGIATGEASVWVTVSRLVDGSFETHRGYLLRLDASTGQILDRITVGRDPTGVALADGSLWVADEADDEVVRIDPDTGDVLDTIELKDGPREVLSAFEGVWVETTFNTPTVSRIDPATGRVIFTLSNVYGVSTGLDSMWVLDESGDPNGALRQVDPMTGAFVAKQYPLEVQPAFVVAGQGQIWLTRWFPAGGPSLSGQVAPGQPANGNLKAFPIDADSMQPLATPVRICPTPGGEQIAFGALWISCSGYLERVDLAEGGPTATESGADSARIVCERDGSTSLLTPQVAVQPDGLHVEVTSRLNEPASVNGLGIDVDRGVSRRTLTTPPGVVGVACWRFSDHGSGDEPRAQDLRIVDPEGLYVSRDLQCPSGGLSWSSIFDFGEPAAGQGLDPIEVARESFRGLKRGDALERTGYPEGDQGGVRVVRNGSTVAVATVSQADDGGWYVSGGSGCSGSDIRLG